MFGPLPIRRRGFSGFVVFELEDAVADARGDGADGAGGKVEGVCVEEVVGAVLDGLFRDRADLEKVVELLREIDDDLCGVIDGGGGISQGEGKFGGLESIDAVAVGVRFFGFNLFACEGVLRVGPPEHVIVVLVVGGVVLLESESDSGGCPSCGVDRRLSHGSLVGARAGGAAI